LSADGNTFIFYHFDRPACNKCIHFKLLDFYGKTAKVYASMAKGSQRSVSHKFSTCLGSFIPWHIVMGMKAYTQLIQCRGGGSAKFSASGSLDSRGELLWLSGKVVKDEKIK
jgi:hypothetical protein